MKLTLKKIQKIWKTHSYSVAPAGYKRMTEIGFMQAIQELGIKIVEK